MWELIGSLVSLFVGAAVIYLAVVTVKHVINWFRNRQALVQSDHANIAFTIKENLANEQYVIYQGVFNRRTEELLDGQKIETCEVDEQLTAMHERQPMVVYQ